MNDYNFRITRGSEYGNKVVKFWTEFKDKADLAWQEFGCGHDTLEAAETFLKGMDQTKFLQLSGKRVVVKSLNENLLLG